MLSGMNWQSKVILIAGVAFLVYTAGYLIYTASMRPSTAYKQMSVMIPGGTMGLADPAPVALDDGTYAMAITSMTTNSQNNLHMNIDILSSGNGGKNWQHVGRAFEGRRDEMVGSDGVTAVGMGNWRYEQPTLVHDPKDAEAPYKLYAFKYFWLTETGTAARAPAVARLSGHIVYKNATTLAGPWSEEWALFGASANVPPAPYNRMILLRVSQLDPALASYTAYGDPAAFVDGDLLVVAMTAYGTQNPMQGRAIILVGSRDHGQSWLYLGTLIGADDFSAIDSGRSGSPINRVSAPGFFRHDGQIYFNASFGTDNTQGLGVWTFRVADLSRAALVRGKKNAIEPLQRITPGDRDTTGYGATQGGYAEGLDGGFMMGQFGSRGFAVWQTNVSPK